MTPLIEACKNDHFPIAKYLVENNAGPNEANESAFEALIAAAECNSIEIIKLLLENGK